MYEYYLFDLLKQTAHSIDRRLPESTDCGIECHRKHSRFSRELHFLRERDCNHQGTVDASWSVSSWKEVDKCLQSG